VRPCTDLSDPILDPTDLLKKHRSVICVTVCWTKISRLAVAYSHFCLNLHVPYCGLCGLCTCARVYEGACLSSKVFLYLFALALCLSGALYDVVTKCAKMLNQMIKYIFPMMIIINQFIRPKSLTRLQGNIDYH
jgi:hypothetical protein